MKERVLVSACLAGCPCRYDGRSNEVPAIRKLVEEGKAAAFCPEVSGGMPTPRIPSELKSNKVYNKEGEDVTEYFEKGAQDALTLCKKENITKAILKAKSPSCGTHQVYDGTFSGKLIDGQGKTAALLRENGISIIDENEFLKESSFE